ncbi:MBL fold metallo-hydrolase [Paracoccus xiamenensis]|uniref:MBL fold metallo-hydrolase n=1 Tax=Paracoccus xiamenensis TaxID=2714901 RepID=UPI001407C817|nr:MBL fold metallo-hydrolase [Paracoccus xiamenensis]NHF74391.1 MBL fold metallo-hydrolase [Paracoccus xiamenensis]
MKRLTALGGFDAKGPACFLLEIDGARLLLDMGRGPDAGRRPDLDGIGPVDAVLISHCHADHTGALDWLGRIGGPPVYATAPTRALSEIAALRAARDLPLRGQIAGVEVETGPAGHAPGAVWMRVGGTSGLVYSGDYAEGLGLLPVGPLPPAEIAVLDCSYGVEKDDVHAQTTALLAKAGTGPCLLPAPPAGRGLEIALACLDRGLSVAICDQIRGVAETLTGFPGWLAEGGAARLRRLLQEARSLRPDGPLDGIMIAAGANCGSGLSQELGPRALAAGVPIIFTGHLSHGSPAASWVQDGRARRFRWNVHPDRATLGQLLTQTRARLVIPAFATPKARQDLPDAFPETRWATDRSITW